MNEKHITSKFTTIFNAYSPRVITSKSVAGWPDRMLQNNYEAIFVEIKSVIPNIDGSFYTGARQEQGVWLAKWKKNGGKCFLFIGVLARSGLFDYYGIIAPDHWEDWLKVAQTKYTLDTMTYAFKTDDQVLFWFNFWVEKQQVPK
ncbi:MAG TPA: hypothetical protein VGG71_05855 [Chitinophagaceae bacterium]